ncbi:MAG: DNA alkylation repair protein [Acetatifactor sp.]|nr:DNA alkylation repair protein [Acetatifactor sp.]
MTTEFIREQLFALQDTEYKNFHAKLMPTVDPDLIIGVRTPELRKLSKKLWKMGETDAFMAELPHHYYEENNLHGFFIEQIKDYDACIDALNVFLPYVDNWATCDMMSPKVLGKNKDRLLAQIRIWLDSEHTYMVRFAIGMLMRHFLDEDFEEIYLDMVADIKSEEYYINMMRAWYFATALAKQYAAVLPYIENCRLDIWTHNKAIQKAVESYRITPEQKNYLRSLKRKGDSHERE